MINFEYINTELKRSEADLQVLNKLIDGGSHFFIFPFELQGCVNITETGIKPEALNISDYTYMTKVVGGDHPVVATREKSTKGIGKPKRYPFMHSKLSFESLNDKLSDSGYSIANYVQLALMGAGYAGPRLRLIKDYNPNHSIQEQVEVFVDPIRTIDVGVWGFQVKLDNTAIIHSVRLMGYPILGDPLAKSYRIEEVFIKNTRMVGSIIGVEVVDKPNGLL